MTLDDIYAARELLDGIVRRTPMEPCRPLEGKIGGPIWLKCENLQRAGAYKVRGALVRISRLSPEERARGVVAASAGNHAQGVAVAAGLLGHPGDRLHAARRAAAEGRRHQGLRRQGPAGRHHSGRVAGGRGGVRRRDRRDLHPPVRSQDVIAGQGTVALEILEQVPDVKTIVAGIGGGGLISGIAVAAKALKPDIRVDRRPGGRGRLDGRVARRRQAGADRSVWPRSPTASPSGAPATSRSPTSTRWSTTSSR